MTLPNAGTDCLVLHKKQLNFRSLDLISLLASSKPVLIKATCWYTERLDHLLPAVKERIYDMPFINVVIRVSVENWTQYFWREDQKALHVFYTALSSRILVRNVWPFCPEISMISTSDLCLWGITCYHTAQRRMKWVDHLASERTT